MTRGKNGNGNGNKGKKRGPKAKITEARYEEAYRLSLLGLTNKELAIAMGVSVATIENYLKNDPEFYAAVKRGKTDADSKVAQSMFKRAIGYSHPDTYITPNRVKVYTQDENGKNVLVEERTEVLQIPIIKHYPPDTSAMIFWLVNRTKQNENPFTNNTRYEVTGKDGGPIETKNLDLSDFTEAELELAASLGKKLNGNASK